MSNAAHLDNVIKRFPGFQLGPLSLDLKPGSVVGYVGPNGSGKTTTMHCLNGLLTADSGEIEVCGRRMDPRDATWKLDIGYVGDSPPFFERWSGARNLEFISRFYPGWSESRARDLAGRFRLPLETRVSELSRGNRVKLALVSVLARAPRLLLLDEPTAGLDPVVRDDVLEVLFDIVGEGERTIFYSTHILSDIGRLADELAFLVDGRLILQCPKDDLTDRWRRISYSVEGRGNDLPAVVRHRREGNDHQVISSDGAMTMERLRMMGARNLRENRMSIDEIVVQILRGDRHAPGA